MKNDRSPRRPHIVSGGVCWCGSTHSWELAKLGFCDCANPRCQRVHPA